MQTDGVDVVNVTSRPEEAVALTVSVGWAIVWAPGLAKVIVWLSLTITGVTVRVVLPLTGPSVALMCSCRLPALGQAGRALIVATGGVADAQPTEPVRSAVVASL